MVTGDEKWCLYVTFKRKVQWLKPSQAAKPTPRPGLHPQKRMLSIWWSVKGVIYWELLPEKNTVNAYRYRNQINKLEAEVINFSGKVYFQHDNAKPHIAKIVKEKIDKFGWELLPHPPYSPDLAPSDYLLFRSLSNDMRGRHFKDEKHLKSFLRDFFDSKTKEFYATQLTKKQCTHDVFIKLYICTYSLHYTSIYIIIKMQKFEVLKNEKYNVGKIQKQRINIVSKTKGKALKQKDIKEIVKKINAKYIREKETEPKILVRGMSPLGVWTIKAYEDSIDEMWEDDEDYFSGRVRDAGTFQSFDQIEISLYS